MGGIFGVASKSDCVMDLFFGIDYHSHLGTRRGGMAVYSRSAGFDRVIHNIENSPFRTKFDKDVAEMEGNLGIGCISDNEPQPLLVRSHLGNFAITTVGKINNIESFRCCLQQRIKPSAERTSLTNGKDTTAPRGPPQSLLCGERRSKGVSVVFAIGGNEGKRTLRRRGW